MNNNTSSTTKAHSKQSTRSNITDLRRNLTLCNEADQALSVLGVPLSIDAAADSQDSSAQESDDPRRRVVNLVSADQTKRTLRSNRHILV